MLFFPKENNYSRAVLRRSSWPWNTILGGKLKLNIGKSMSLVLCFRSAWSPEGIKNSSQRSWYSWNHNCNGVCVLVTNLVLLPAKSNVVFCKAGSPTQSTTEIKTVGWSPGNWFLLTPFTASLINTCWCDWIQRRCIDAKRAHGLFYEARWAHGK